MLVSRGQTVFTENGLGNDVASFCSDHPRNFWEINETHKGVNKPMVSNVKPLRHRSLHVVIASDGTDHWYACNNVNTFTCFINFPEIPWVVRTKTCNVVAQTVFCARLWRARSRSDHWPRETRVANHRYFVPSNIYVWGDFLTSHTQPYSSL